ncbi:hypothetical protein MLD38_003133 [Melastoma candidum]|uniref:Uncharacterized protein n=1 Tax=Melastoma candidum TaxID=119954 RepID=A0ACB9S5E6_9MYRT|nr:hypothetical protein MLD38_003133 [Melastoma candidum]
MKFYISATGIKRLTVSNAKGSPRAMSPGRRIGGRAVLLPVMVAMGIVLPFLFVRVAFVVLESAAACSSSSAAAAGSDAATAADCLRWRLFSGNDATLLREELTSALLEAKERDDINNNMNDQGMVATSTDSFDDLVREISTSRKANNKAFALKTKAMLRRMEQRVHLARQRELVYWHLASHGIPKGFHCLCLKLAEEYTINAMARSRLPPAQYASRLADLSYLHVVVLTDNVLAASVVISSACKTAANPESFVFHIITDKKTYTAMHTWFAINPVEPAVIEVKGLHQYDWPEEVNNKVKEVIDFHRQLWSQFYGTLKEKEMEEAGDMNIMTLSPSYSSVLNQLRIFIPELFPDLNKVVLLDDDVVVQQDLSPLWELDLNGNVIAAVVEPPHGRKYEDYLNFSHPVISSNFKPDECVWLDGMNVLDLSTWRRNNLTERYLQWLKLNSDSGFTLWNPGTHSPNLIIFEDRVQPIDPSWHLSGLGQRFPEHRGELLETAADYGMKGGREVLARR